MPLANVNNVPTAPVLNIVELCAEFKNKITLNLLTLHSKNNFSREDVLYVKEIIKDTTQFCGSLLSQHFKNDLPKSKKLDFETVTNMLDQPFSGQETEYEFVEYLKNI